MKVTIQCEEHEVAQVFQKYESMVREWASARERILNLEDEVFTLKEQVKNLQGSNPVIQAQTSESMKKLSFLMGAMVCREKILAIKFIREITQCGLKKAKYLVEGLLVEGFDNNVLCQKNCDLTNFWNG